MGEIVLAAKVTHVPSMLFGLLGWDKYEGKAEVFTDYFPSSGTGQCNVVFPLT